MRNLASIQRISNLEPIEKADSIEKATVLGWQVVVKKGDFKTGDLCVYCEIDSILPERPEFEFMRDRKFRVKTIKLKGQVSQGICFPVSILPEEVKITEGKDVTDILGIKKWEPYQEDLVCCSQVNKLVYPQWMPRWLIYVIHRFGFIRMHYKKNSGQKSFPSLIPKTDETRVQVLQPLLTKYKGTKCYVTEKLDGSSMTVYQINGKFGVCSRKIDLRYDRANKYWKVAIEHDLERKFKKIFGNADVAMQGELIGEGIQGNKYKLRGNDVYFFNIFHIRKFIYGDMVELFDVCEEMKEKMVPLICTDYILSDSIPSLVDLSKNKSMLANIPREGIVIRPLEEIEDRDLDCILVKNRISFKSVNPEFLLKYGE